MELDGIGWHWMALDGICRSVYTRAQVDLVKVFPTSRRILHSNEHVIAAIGFDTAENGPFRV